MRPAITALVFDFDGTLVDTETPIFEVWAETYRRRGFELTRELWQDSLGSHGRFEPSSDLARRSGRALTEEELLEVRSEIRRRCAAQPLAPGARPLLTEARARGWRTAIASSSTLEWVERWLGRLEARHLFDHLACREHAARVKPAPDLYLRATELLGRPPAACLAVEDSPHGARAAGEAGLPTVVVPNAMTHGLPFPEAALLLPTLEGVTLEELLEAVRKLAAVRSGDVGG